MEELPNKMTQTSQGTMPVADRLIFLIFAILICIPFIAPLGLPLKISPSTQTYYNYLVNVKPGGVIIWSEEQSFANWPELGPAEVSTYYLLLKSGHEKGTKFIVVSPNTDGAAVADRIFKQLKPEIDAWGLKYGVDYANLGYVTGLEAMYALVVRDFQALTTRDYYGTPVGDLPIMTGLKDVRNFDLMGFCISTSAESYMRQWWGYANSLGITIPILNNVQAAGAPINAPFVSTGQLSGMVSGLRGGAEMERLSGKLGFGTISIDAYSITHLYAIGLIITANVWFFTKGRRKKE